MKTAARGGGERSHPAAYVPGRTTGSRRLPAAAGAPAPRAAHLTDGGHHRRRLPGNERNRKKRPTITQNARKLARKSVSVRITYNNAHANKRRGGVVLQNWRKNAGQQPRATPASCGGHRLPSIRGEVYNSEGPKESAVCRSSPPRLNVLHTGFNTRAISLSAPAPMFPSPARQSALLTQVTGKLGGGGVVLKPGRKNETVKRPRSKNKNFGGRKRHICEREVRPLCGAGAEAAAWCWRGCCVVVKKFLCFP